MVSNIIMKTKTYKYLWFPLMIFLFGVSDARAQRPVQLGFVYILSGAFASYGEFARQGALMAVDEINRKGGINGRLVITWFENSRSKPDVARQAIHKLVIEKQVDCLIGIDSSNVAQRMAPVAAKLKTPLIITNAATPDVTGTLCNRYVFRVSTNLTQNIKAAAILAARSGAQTWTTVGKKHTFSYQSWEYFQKYLQAGRPAVKTLPDEQVVFIPSRTKDFTPYLEKMIKSGADGILVTLWGGYLKRFVRQADSMGLFDGRRQVLLTMGASLDSLSDLGDSMPENLWVGAPYWFLANGSALNKNFVKNYHARFKKYPTHQAHGAYGAVYAFKAAAEKAGSTDKEAVVSALEGLTVELPGGTTTFRPEDHQGVSDLWWGRTFKDPAYPMKILKPLKRFKGKDITRSPAETRCVLK
jgi:branched-chain amino acid transport system substrate-binding protein